MSDRWLKERSADAERRFREMVAVGEVPFHGVLSLLQELAGYGGVSPESIRAAGVILGSLTRANLDRLLAKGAQEVAACARRLAEQTARELDRAADERGVGSRGDIPVELVRRPAVTVLHLRSELLLVTAALQALAWALDPPSEPVIAY